MKRSKVSVRETVLLVFLVVLLAGVLYYTLFYQPLQEEMAQINSQSLLADEQTSDALARLQKKKNMEAELEQILAQPKDQITEFAPYDNKEVVLNMLYGILGRTWDYSLNFTDPEVAEDGTVRRNISLSFTCESFDSARQVISDLTRCKWRCLISNCAISAAEHYRLDEEPEIEEPEEMDRDNIMSQAVKVSLTITFFESDKLN